MGKMYKLLKEGLNDIIEHQKGKKRLKTRTIEIPEPKPAKSYSAKDVKRIRASLQYPQVLFAKLLNVSIKTVQSWESGRRVPSHAALRLLEFIDKGYYDPQFKNH